MTQIKINGLPYDVEQDATILETINKYNIEHPQVCYVPSVDPIKTCDTCIVEVDGQLVRSCSTKAVDGMNIQLDSPNAKGAQTEAMDRLLENHMLYCTVCDNNNGNCTLHNTTEMMGIEHQKYPFSPKEEPENAVDSSHPFYRYDANQCIACGQCVEVCQNLQVNETLSLDWEAERPRVIWDEGVDINDSSCVSCGQCVTVCPCNALMEKSMLGEAGFMTSIKQDTLEPMIDLIKEVEPGYSGIFAISEIEAAMRSKRTKKTKTVCTFCGVGCSFEVWTKGRKILKVQPSEGPVNAISTCVKGKFGWDFVNSEERITKPLIRKNDEFVESSWDEALDLIATKLGGIQKEHGPGSVGFISSSKITNEENYLIQKMARQLFETNDVDNCSRYCQSPASDGLQRTVGIGGDAGTIKDIAKAGLVIIVGANPAEGHPVLATRVKRAHKLHGQKLIVSDVRKNEMAERSDIYMHPNQGTDQVWLMAVTKYIIDQGWHDEAFIQNNVNFYEEFKQVLDKYTLEYAEKETGISKETLIEVAKMIKEADGTCVLWGMGVTQNNGGSYTSAAISNLLLATGNYRRPGAGAYPLRGHNNVQGACDMGTLPNVLPGYQKVTDDAARQKFEEAYGSKIPAEPGRTNMAMLDAITDGDMKAMYLVGEDMALVDCDSNHVDYVLSQLEFFVVQDCFLSRTAQYADVILPASPSLEKEGTFTNTERRVQRLYQVLPSLGESKPDWVILQDVARRLDADWNYSHPSEIFAEMASLTPFFAQANYDVLENWGSFCWGSLDGKDTPLLYEDGFNFPDKKARFALNDWIPPVEYEAQYDCLINNGRILEHFHEGNMTNKSQGIQSKVPEIYVEVSPELAKERGIEEGALLRLVSPNGALKLPALITDRVQGNELFLPMNSTSKDSAINFLTGQTLDVNTSTPAYKQTKVRVEVLKSKGKSPLPRTNPRSKKRHPQNGVEVQRKWDRPGYVHLTTNGGE